MRGPITLAFAAYASAKSGASSIARSRRSTACRSVRAQPGAQVQSPEIQVVRLETWRPLRPRRGGARWELQFQRGGDLSRDLVLDGDDVRHLAVVVLRPDVVARFGVDELRRHAKPIALLPNAALEHRLDAERVADDADVELVVAQRER